MDHLIVLHLIGGLLLLNLQKLVLSVCLQLLNCEHSRKVWFRLRCVGESLVCLHHHDLSSLRQSESVHRGRCTQLFHSPVRSGALWLLHDGWIAMLWLLFKRINCYTGGRFNSFFHHGFDDVGGTDDRLATEISGRHEDFEFFVLGLCKYSSHFKSAIFF